MTVHSPITPVSLPQAPYALRPHNPYTQTHPTPCEIGNAILRALIADRDNPATPEVPVHVGQLVQDAISAACDAKEAGQ